MPVKSLLCLLTLTATAHADPKPLDVASPDATVKLAGTVAVWVDATFYLDTDVNGARLQLATFPGPRKDAVGQVVPMKVIGTTGELVEVEPTSGTDCTWTRLPLPEQLAKLRLFVKRSDLSPLITKPFSKTWPNGTRIEVRAGLPVVEAQPGGYRIALDRVSLSAPLPASSIGYSYRSGGGTRPKSQESKFLVSAGDATIGDLTSTTSGSIAVPAVTRRKGSTLVAVGTTCFKATLSVPSASISEGGMGTGIGYGTGSGTLGTKHGERWLLTKGTALYAPGGKRQVAEVAEVIELGKPDGKPDVCVVRDIGFDHPYPEAPRPKSAKAKLMLCTPATNVKHVDDAPPIR